MTVINEGQKERRLHVNIMTTEDVIDSYAQSVGFFKDASQNFMTAQCS